MPTPPACAVQVLQVLTVLVAGPLVSGCIARAEAIVQRWRRPRVLQPYYDMAVELLGATSVPVLVVSERER